MDSLVPLLAACVFFVGTHFLMSHPARRPLIARLGEKGFLGLYSLVSFAGLGWMMWEFSQAPAGELYWAPTNAIWIAASLLTLLAAVLFAGSFQGNPALPDPEGDVIRTLAAKVPTGVFRVTRHPMMWGIGLWALAHILVLPAMDSILFNGSILFLALAGSYGQDRKKEAALGGAWSKWERQTSFLPRLSQLARVEPRFLLIGLLFWLAASWAHGLFGADGAGIYRWL